MATFCSPAFCVLVCVCVCVCMSLVRSGIFNGARALTFKSQLVVFINVIKLSDNVVYCFYGFPNFGLVLIGITGRMQILASNFYGNRRT